MDSSTAAGVVAPTNGDIAFTPHYDTTYQHYHGYNERNMAAKAAHWESEYQWHAPSAERIRQRFVVKPGRDEQRRTQPINAEVADILQSRTALLGRTCDLSTANSLRVTARHGEAQPLGQSAYPVPFAATATGAHVGAHDAWAARTIPAERTSSTRMGGASAKLNHPSSNGCDGYNNPSSLGYGSRGRGAAQWNSRQPSYETEYLSTFCDARQAEQWTTKRPDFYTASLGAFEEAAATARSGSAGGGASLGREGSSLAVNNGVFKVERPSTPTQPFSERVDNERISSPGLESMRRPVHRKTFHDLDGSPTAMDRARNSSRMATATGFGSGSGSGGRTGSGIASPPGTGTGAGAGTGGEYSFDMRVHIERMRPSPLFKDMRGTVAQSETLQQRPVALAETAAMYLSDRQLAARLRSMD